MNRVGKALQWPYHWVPIQTPIYLVLDNASGHGSSTCITNYVQILKDRFNVEFVHQIPRSLFTNTLDLGYGQRFSWRLNVATS